MGSCYSQKAVKASTDFPVMAGHQPADSKLPAPKSRFGFKGSQSLRSSNQDISTVNKTINGKKENLKIEDTCKDGKLQNGNNTPKKFGYGVRPSNGKVIATKEKDVINGEIQQVVCCERPVTSEEASLVNNSNIVEQKGKRGELTKPNNLKKPVSSENLTRYQQNLKQDVKRRPPSGLLPPSGKLFNNKKTSSQTSLEKLNGNVGPLNKAKGQSKEKLASDNKLKRPSFGFSYRSKQDEETKDKGIKSQTSNMIIDQQNKKQVPENSKEGQPRPKSLLSSVQKRNFGFQKKPRPVSAVSASSETTDQHMEKSLSCSSLDSADLILNTDCAFSDVSSLATPREDIGESKVSGKADDVLNTTFLVEDSTRKLNDMYNVEQSSEMFSESGDSAKLNKGDKSAICSATVISGESISDTCGAIPALNLTDVILNEPMSDSSSPNVGECNDSGYNQSVPMYKEHMRVLRTVSESGDHHPRIRHLSSCDDSDMLMVDIHTYRYLMNELTTTKTMLFKLKRFLQEAPEQLFSGMNGMKLTEETDEVNSMVVQQLTQENKQLQEEIANLKEQLARKENLQQLKANLLSTATKDTNSVNAATQTDRPKTKLDKRLLRSQSENDGQAVIRHSPREAAPQSVKLYFHGSKYTDEQHCSNQPITKSTTKPQVMCNDNCGSDLTGTIQNDACKDYNPLSSPKIVNSNSIVTADRKNKENYENVEIRLIKTCHDIPVKTPDFIRLPKPKSLSRLPIGKRS